ncbi:unnamed protein product [Peniophora sp. CBMAI 1063]|nr:unnamed protein product [Peniophora sp. CBMAI 1063]
MAAVDPTYPLYPTGCILASAMLLLVLLTSFVRQSWNFGVAFLCFWLFVETLIEGINAIIWSDNADIKLYVYCDIISHVQMFASVVKPMATLIIMRRLYLITSLQSVKLPSKAEKRRDLAVEWILGLVIPLIIAGPLYYVVQPHRFEVDEGLGCTNSTDGSILSILLLYSWSVILPMISITVYYPRVALIFYRQNRDINRFLHSNHSVSRTNYLRILALAHIDILFTLPIGIANIVLSVRWFSSLYGSLPFYFGWTQDHSDWEPVSIPYTVLVAAGPSGAAEYYVIQWLSPVLAFAIFGLFGLTSEARASYWSIICVIGTLFGLGPMQRREDPPLRDMEFGHAGPLSLGFETKEDAVCGTRERRGSDSDEGEIEEARRTSSDTPHAGHHSPNREAFRVKTVGASGVA